MLAKLRNLQPPERLNPQDNKAYLKNLQNFEITTKARIVNEIRDLGGNNVKNTNNIMQLKKTLEDVKTSLVKEIKLLTGATVVSGNNLRGQLKNARTKFQGLQDKLKVYGYAGNMPKSIQNAETIIAAKELWKRTLVEKLKPKFNNSYNLNSKTVPELEGIKIKLDSEESMLKKNLVKLLPGSENQNISILKEKAYTTLKALQARLKNRFTNIQLSQNIKSDRRYDGANKKLEDSMYINGKNTNTLKLSNNILDIVIANVEPNNLLKIQSYLITFERSIETFEKTIGEIQKNLNDTKNKQLRKNKEEAEKNNILNKISKFRGFRPQPKITQNSTIKDLRTALEQAKYFNGKVERELLASRKKYNQRYPNVPIPAYYPTPKTSQVLKKVGVRMM